MTGCIKFTDRDGGYITADNDRSNVRFNWRDCDDINASSVGHGVRVRFYIEVVRGRDRAIGVARA